MLNTKSKELGKCKAQYKNTAINNTDNSVMKETMDSVHIHASCA